MLSIVIQAHFSLLEYVVLARIVSYRIYLRASAQHTRDSSTRATRYPRTAPKKDRGLTPLSVATGCKQHTLATGNLSQMGMQTAPATSEANKSTDTQQPQSPRIAALQGPGLAQQLNRATSKPPLPQHHTIPIPACLLR